MLLGFVTIVFAIISGLSVGWVLVHFIVKHW